MSTAIDQQPDPLGAAYEIGEHLVWAGLVALFVGSAVPLGFGMLNGWSAVQLGLQVSLTVGLFLLFSHQRIPVLCRLLAGRVWLYVVAMAILSFLLLVTNGDPFLQPIVLCVPLVTAALAYSFRQTLLVGLGLLLLIPLGLWLHGNPLVALISSTSSYGALMLLIGAFVRLAQGQSAARREADRLAFDLARQRDELAQLYAQAGLTATLAERNRLARELHDTVAQELTAVLLQLEAAQRSFERDPERARARMLRAHELAHGALDNVRRSVWTLADPLIGPAELSDALAEVAQRFNERTGVVCRYTQHGPVPHLSAAAATQTLRIVQEALQNVEKHAHATQVEIEVHVMSDTLQIDVRDNGVGFAVDAPIAPTGGGFGLISLRERARLAGGKLQIVSATGAGTCVSLYLAVGTEPGLH